MKTNRLFSTVSILVLCLTATAYQVQAQQQGSRSTSASRPADATGQIDLTTMLAQARRSNPRGFSLLAKSRNVAGSAGVFSFGPMATGPGLPVTGGGTLGRLTKWMGFTSSNAAIGDSSIYEDKLGKVGIGTDSPTSKLTVVGVIESTAGFKFPDGTIVSEPGVVHDATLAGVGTAASPLSVVSEESRKQVWSETFTGLVFTPGSGQVSESVSVPTGKRFVIELVSGSCDLLPGQRPISFSISTRDGHDGVGRFYELVPTLLGDTTTRSWFSATHPMRLYAAPDSSIIIAVQRNVTTGSCACSASISGFLVDLP